MKYIYSSVILGAICFAIAFAQSKVTPVQIVERFFEYARKGNEKRALALWKAPAPQRIKATSDQDLDEYRFDQSYFREIGDFQYQITSSREFVKDDNSSTVCLSLIDLNKRPLIFRVELQKESGAWSIIGMKDAREDALAAIHNDCSTWKVKRSEDDSLP